MQNNSISQISNFKHGDQIKGFYVCKSLQNKITRLGDEYLDLILEDSSGSIRAKIWSYVDEYRQKIEKGFHVAVKGKIITFNDALEIDVLYSVVFLLLLLNITLNTSYNRKRYIYSTTQKEFVAI